MHGPVIIKRLSAVAAVVLWAMCGIAHAQQQNVYDFVFTGTYYPDDPFGSGRFGTGPAVDFTVTFLANSPTLPLPPFGASFGAAVNAYVVNVTAGSQIIEQNGKGGFSFNGLEIGLGPSGEWIGGGWDFSTTSFAWDGVEEFGLGNPDPLHHAGYWDLLGETWCSVGTSGPVYCNLRGDSVDISASVPEPPVWALLLAGLVLLAMLRLPQKYLSGYVRDIA